MGLLHLLLSVCAVLVLFARGSSAALQADDTDSADLPILTPYSRPYAAPFSPALSSLDLDDIVDPFSATPPHLAFPRPQPDPESSPFETVALPSPLPFSTPHIFDLLGLTGGNSEDFSMSGLVHTQLQGGPATFSDMYLTVHDYAEDDGLYHGLLSLNISCANGTVTWLDEPGLLILAGDAAVSNGSLTFMSLSLESTVAVLNEALSVFTFTPVSPAWYGNATCGFEVATNTSSPYIAAFLFEVLQSVTGPAPNSVLVSFNLTVAPPQTSQYALYKQLQSEIADVLDVDADRISIVSVSIDDVLNYTAVLVDFLPPPGMQLSEGPRNNDTAQALAAAFLALTPAQLSGTEWLHYADISAATQLCSDGVYRSLCSVVVPAAVAAAVAITSTLAFIVGVSVAGAAVVVGAAGSTVLYKRWKRARAPPTSPMIKSASQLMHEALDEPPLIHAPPADNAVDAAALVAVSEEVVHPAAPEVPPPLRSRPSRVSLSLSPASAVPPPPAYPLRRSLRHSSRVQLKSGAAPGGADRLERDLLERVRDSENPVGRRFVYQPSILLQDERIRDEERRHSLLHYEERERGSLISEAYDSGHAASVRSSFTSPAHPTASTSYVPPILRREGHLHYAMEGDSDDESIDGDGPRFLDATTESSSPPLVSHLAEIDVPDVRVDIAADGGLAAGKAPGVGDPQALGRWAGEEKSRLSRRSTPGSVLRRVGGVQGPLDGLHIGYEAPGSASESGSHTPSLSTQDVLGEWLAPAEELDHAAFQHLVAPGMQPARGPAPAVENSKRMSWSAINARRASGGGRGQGQRIVLDLAMAGRLYPAQGTVKASAEGVAGEVKGWGGSGAPLMKPLIANAAPHPRMSFYQRSLF